jgi:hypothetical protein
MPDDNLAGEMQEFWKQSGVEAPKVSSPTAAPATGLASEMTDFWKENGVQVSGVAKQVTPTPTPAAPAPAAAPPVEEAPKPPEKVPSAMGGYLPQAIAPRRPVMSPAEVIPDFGGRQEEPAVPPVQAATPPEQPQGALPGAKAPVPGVPVGPETTAERVAKNIPEVTRGFFEPIVGSVETVVQGLENLLSIPERLIKHGDVTSGPQSWWGISDKVKEAGSAFLKGSQLGLPMSGEGDEYVTMPGKIIGGLAGFAPMMMAGGGGGASTFLQKFATNLMTFGLVDSAKTTAQGHDPAAMLEAAKGSIPSAVLFTVAQSLPFAKVVSNPYLVRQLEGLATGTAMMGASAIGGDRDPVSLAVQFGVGYGTHMFGTRGQPQQELMRRWVDKFKKDYNLSDDEFKEVMDVFQGKVKEDPNAPAPDPAVAEKVQQDLQTIAQKYGVDQTGESAFGKTPEVTTLTPEAKKEAIFGGKLGETIEGQANQADAVRALVPQIGDQARAERFYDLYQKGDADTALKEFPEMSSLATAGIIDQPMGRGVATETPAPGAAAPPPGSTSLPGTAAPEPTKAKAPPPEEPPSSAPARAGGGTVGLSPTPAGEAKPKAAVPEPTGPMAPMGSSGAAAENLGKTTPPEEIAPPAVPGVSEEGIPAPVERKGKRSKLPQAIAPTTPEEFTQKFGSNQGAPEGLVTAGERMVSGERVAPETPGVSYHDNFPRDQIQLNPDVWQHKMAETGAGQALSHIKNKSQWDAQAARETSLYRYPDGHVELMDGHSRMTAGDRVDVSGYGVRIYDGNVFTVEDARATAALTNIRQGTGTVVDSAKGIRDFGFTLEDLAQRGVDLNSEHTRIATGLANLSDPIFTAVAKGDFPAPKGAIIGEQLPGNPDAQEAIYRLIQKKHTDKNGNISISDEKLKNDIRFAEFSKVVPTRQPILGEEFEDFAKANLVSENSDLMTYAAKKLANEKNLFKTVSAKAQKLIEAGNKIKPKINEKISNDAAIGLAVLDKAAFVPGSKTNLLFKEFAAKLQESGNKNQVKEEFYARLPQALEADRDAAGLGQSVGGRVRGKVPAPAAPGELPTGPGDTTTKFSVKEAAPGLSAQERPTSKLETRLTELQGEYPDIDRDKASQVLRSFPKAENDQVANMVADPEMFNRVVQGTLSAVEQKKFGGMVKPGLQAGLFEGGEQGKPGGGRLFKIKEDAPITPDTPLFHGQSEPFEGVKAGNRTAWWEGRGFYLTNDPDYAKNYTRGEAKGDVSEHRLKEGATVLDLSVHPKEQKALWDKVLTYFIKNTDLAQRTDIGEFKDEIKAAGDGRQLREFVAENFMTPEEAYTFFRTGEEGKGIVHGMEEFQKHWNDALKFAGVDATAEPTGKPGAYQMVVNNFDMLGTKGESHPQQPSLFKAEEGSPAVTEARDALAKSKNVSPENLKYIGDQEGFEEIPGLHLFNIMDPEHPEHGSTVAWPMSQGDALFKTSKGVAFTQALTTEQIKSRLGESGTVSEIASESTGKYNRGWTIKFKNDQMAFIFESKEGSLFLTGDTKDLGPDYAAIGRTELRPGEKIAGAFRPIGLGSVIELARGEGLRTFDHESWHNIEHWLLNDKERAALARDFGDNEEVRAEAYANWKPKEAPNTIFQKILDFFQRIVKAITGKVSGEDVFAAARSGELFKREPVERRLPAAIAPRKLKVEDNAETGAEKADPIRLDANGLIRTSLLQPWRHGGDILKGIQRAIVPGAVSKEHREAAYVLRSHLGAMNQEGFDTATKVKTDRRMFDKMGINNPNLDLTTSPEWKMASDISMGRPVETQFQGTARKIIAENAARMRRMQAAEVPLDTFRENYFGMAYTPESRRAFNQAVSEAVEAGRGMEAIEGNVGGQTMNLNEWSDTDKAWVKTRVKELMAGGQGSDESAAGYLVKRPMQGRESFKQPKVFDDALTGMEFGLVPLSANPVDMFLLKALEMDRSIYFHGAIKDFKAKGDVVANPIAKRIPEGWVKLEGPYGTIQGPYDPATGARPVYGQWIAKEAVGELINNSMAQSLYNNPYFGKAFKGFMATGNLMNQFQLMSGFHVGFTALETQISAGAEVIKDVLGVARGERAFGDLGRTLKKYPTAMARFAMEGNRTLAEYANPSIDVPTNVSVANLPNTPEYRAALVAKAAREVGGGFTMEHQFRTHWQDKMIKEWYGGQKIKAALRSPVVLSEMAMKPIMDFLVPRQKAGVFGDLVGRILEQNPSKTLEQLRPELNDAWNRVDSRLGQVRYDRIFMRDGAKNALQAIFRAPGWTGGTLAEVGGAQVDAVRFIKEWASTGKAPKGIPDRVAYTISLLGTMAIANGLMTYLFTGEKPDGMDWWAFRTGELDSKGRQVRFLMPSYVKDLFAWYEAPGHTAVAKTHPLWSMIGELARNKDYYNTLIRDPESSQAQQMVDMGKYALRQYIPFGVRGIQQVMEYAKFSEEPGRFIAPQIGIMPAPRAYTSSPAQKVIDEYNLMTRSAYSTKDTAEKKKLKADLMKMARDEDQAGFDDLAAESIADGKITRQQVQEVVKESQIPDGLTRFTKLPLEWAMRAFEAGSDYEKEQWQPYILKKVMTEKPENLVKLREPLAALLQGMGLTDLAEQIGELSIPEKGTRVDTTGLGILKEAHTMGEPGAIEGALEKSLSDRLAKLEGDKGKRSPVNPVARTKEKKNPYKVLGF